MTHLAHTYTHVHTKKKSIDIHEFTTSRELILQFGRAEVYSNWLSSSSLALQLRRCHSQAQQEEQMCRKKKKNAPWPHVVGWLRVTGLAWIVRRQERRRCALTYTRHRSAAANGRSLRHFYMLPSADFSRVTHIFCDVPRGKNVQHKPPAAKCSPTQLFFWRHMSSRGLCQEPLWTRADILDVKYLKVPYYAKFTLPVFFYNDMCLYPVREKARPFPLF